MYVVGFVITAAVAAIVVGASGGSADLEAVCEPFHNAQFTALTSSEPDYEVFPATTGVAFVAIPYMLFIAGARFGRWNAYQGIELPEQVLAGAAVVVDFGGEIATELGINELPLVVAEVGSQLILESQLTPPQSLE